MKLVLESIGTLRGKTIEGVALTPTVSLNGNIYSIEEIDKIAGLNTPHIADWEHTDERVGSVIYELKEHTVFYKITMDSEARMKEIIDSNGQFKVSIEADVNNIIESCTKSRCYNLVEGISLSGIGITKTPGVQYTTFNIIESSHEWTAIIEKNCVKCIKEEEDLKLKVERLEAEIISMNRPKCTTCGKHKTEKLICDKCGGLKEAEDDEEDGQWITVGGRKIFIKDGEDKDDAVDKALGGGSIKTGSSKDDAVGKKQWDKLSDTAKVNLIATYGSSDKNDKVTKIKPKDVDLTGMKYSDLDKYVKKDLVSRGKK